MRADDLQTLAFMRNRVAQELRVLRAAEATHPDQVARQHTLTIELWMMHERPLEWVAFNSVDWVMRLLVQTEEEKNIYTLTKKYLWDATEREFNIKGAAAMVVVERALVESMMDDAFVAAFAAAQV